MSKQRQERKLLSIETVLLSDDNPDLSYLGKWASRRDVGYKDYYIDRATGELRCGLDGEVIATCPTGGVFVERHAYEFCLIGFNYTPPGADDPEFPRYCFEDWKRMEAYNDQEWEMYGVIARAKWTDEAGYLHIVDSPGLWGVESDSEQGYFTEVAEEQLEELKEDLMLLGFTDEQIKAATNLEEVKTE